MMTASNEADFVFQNGVITGYTGAGGDVVIPATIGGQAVTSIGDLAFSWKQSLTSITLPAGLTSIGALVFSGCSSLTSVTLPAGLTSIGDWAFSGCSSLTSITLPAGLTSIGGHVFQQCSGLTSVTLPAGLASVGDGAFSGCTGLTSIAVSVGNEFFTSVGGVLYDNTGTHLISYPAGRQGLFLVPPPVTSIRGGAFSGCGGLTGITLPQNLQSIGDWAFSDCTSLTSIVIPAGILSINAGTFSNCTSLTSVTLPEGLTRISMSAFYRCSGLTSIVIPANVRSISPYAFYGCSGLTSIMLPAGVTSIGDSAFSGCSSLTGLTLPAGLTSVGNRAFSGCSGLTSIALPTVLTSIGEQGFWGCSGLTSVTIPASVTTIGYGVLSACDNLTSVSVSAANQSFKSVDGILYDKSGVRLICCPANRQGHVVVLPTVTSIENSAFSGCDRVTSITLPSSLTSIGDWAFSNCSNLTAITLPAGVTGIGDAAFIFCTALTSITLPAGLTSIGGWAFDYCTSLKTFYFLGNAPDVGSYKIAVTAPGATIYYRKGTTGWTNPFAGLPTSVASVPSAPTNVTGIRANGKVTLTWSPPASNSPPVTDYVIQYSSNNGSSWVTFKDGKSTSTSATVTGLTNDVGYVFRVRAVNVVGAGPLSANSLPVTPSIEADFVFENGVITGYTGAGGDVVIPATIGGQAVTSIGESAFYFKGTITSIALPASVTNIGAGAFSFCTSLTSITFPANLKGIGANAFFYCSGLKSITLPAGVASIGYSAFSYCTSLTSVMLPAGLTSIGDRAFDHCLVLTSITVPAENQWFQSIGGVLYNKSVSQLIAYPAGKQGGFTPPSTVTSIGTAAFHGCTGLTSITLPAGVTSVGNWAFSGCSGLTSLTLSAGLSSIGTAAFHGCTGLTNITLPAGVRNIGDWAFSYCNGLTSITLPAGLTSIEWSAFFNCTGLTNITLPAGVMSIEGYVFAHCTALRTVYFLGNAPTVGSGAFTNTASNATIYYRAGTTGWTNPFAGLPTKVASVPSAPTSLTVTPANGRVTLTWAAPTSSSPPITDYVVQYSPDRGNTWTTFSDSVSTTRSTTITGLTNGTSYVFRVAAQNLAGQGAFSANSSFVTPRTVPGVPTRVVGTLGNGQVRLTWAAPVSNGGAAITDYVIQYRATTASTWTTFEDGVSTSRSATVTGLTNGVSYVFRVAAKNAAGTGAFSAISRAVTPRLPTLGELLGGRR